MKLSPNIVKLLTIIHQQSFPVSASSAGGRVPTTLLLRNWAKWALNTLGTFKMKAHYQKWHLSSCCFDSNQKKPTATRVYVFRCPLGSEDAWTPKVQGSEGMPVHYAHRSVDGHRIWWTVQRQLGIMAWWHSWLSPLANEQRKWRQRRKYQL